LGVVLDTRNKHNIFKGGEGIKVLSLVGGIQQIQVERLTATFVAIVVTV